MNVSQEGLRKHLSKSVFYTEEDKPQLQRDPTETQSYIVTQKTRNILFGLLGLAFLVGAIYWIQTVKAAHAQNMFGSKETNRCCFLFNCRLLFIIFIISTPWLVVSLNFCPWELFCPIFICSFSILRKFSTWIWRLPFAVYVKLKLSILTFRCLF